MRQLMCTGPNWLEWREVPDPVLPGEAGALIRPIAVARCEIDPLLIGLGPTIDAGFAVGHETIAEIVVVGSGVAGLSVGDVVACSFEVSCGHCRSCAAGRTALCDEYPILSDYGMQTLSGIEYGGMVADLVAVPHAEAMLVPVPISVDPTRIASVADNVSDGYRAVAPHLEAHPGADVLVVCHAARSIALYATLAAVALGAGSVTFTSDDDEALTLAASLGADAVRTDFGRPADRWPIVVDCGNNPAGLLHAITSTEPEGVLQSVSYYADLTPLPLGKMYVRGIRFVIGRAHAAALLPEVMALIADGRLDPGAVTPTVIAWDAAATSYLDDAIKLVVAR